MKNARFTKDIRTKITISMIFCSFVMALLVSSICIFIHYNHSKKEINEKLILLSENYSNNFDSDFKAIEASVNTLQQYISVTFDLEKFNLDPNGYTEQYEKNMDNIIKKVAESTNGVQGVYFTFNPKLTGKLHESWFADISNNGAFIKQPSNYLEEFYADNKDMCWYYKPIAQNKGVWDKPSIDPVVKTWMISYTKPIYKDNVLLGVVGMDINLEAMKKKVESFKIYKTGFSFVFDENYNFLFHPTLSPKDNLKSIDNDNFKYVAEEINKKNSGIFKYKFNGVNKLLGYSHLSNGWILVFTVPVSEVYSSLKTQIVLTIITMLLSICIIIAIALYLGKSISTPIVKITQLIKNTANFNFTDDNSLEVLIKNKDEIGVMAKQMFNMRKILKETGVDKAAHLQKQYLQKEFPIPDKVNMDTLYIPSKTVSGDFYHMEKINDNLVVGVICDVSGKGVTAALNISAFNVLFHDAVFANQNPVNILNDLNVKVAGFLGETYIAACCFSFDFKNNIAKVAGAGINQFMYSSNKEYYEEKDVKGPFLGMFKDSIFEQEIIYFKPGDKFYFLSDGLELMFSDNKLRNDFTNILEINELVKFLHSYLADMQTENGSIKDDCTLIAIEMNSTLI